VFTNEIDWCATGIICVGMAYNLWSTLHRKKYIESCIDLALAALVLVAIWR
jgi:hypothetical protein